MGLNAFINSVELLKTTAGNTHLALLRQFIIARLEGKALEAVPEDANSIDDIVTALKSKIKPDSSKVVAGRMMALRSDKTNLQDFSKQAEELADSLRRSLIVEGISQAKAHEMTVDKTVEMCRASAKTDLVKSILAATSFTDPKDVVAKFIVESATETKEKQVLAYKQFNNNNNFSKKKGKFSYNNAGRGRGNNSNNYSNRKGNNNNNNNYRGKYYNNDKRRNNNGNNGNQYDRNVRYYQENSDAPSQDGRGMNQMQQNLGNNQNHQQYTA